VRNAYKNLTEKPEEKTLLEMPMRRWEDNIKMFSPIQGLGHCPVPASMNFTLFEAYE
jgi:hypothetical protein